MSRETRLTIVLSSDSVRIEPGTSCPVTVTLCNGSDHDDTVGLAVDGIPSEWVAIPVGSVIVPAGQTVEEKIVFKTPRHSSSVAGSYPLVIRAQSYEEGDEVVAQATLDVAPFLVTSAEVFPKRARCGGIPRSAFFEVTVDNPGNVPLRVRLHASDAEDLGIYTFDTEYVDLAPGESSAVTMSVEPSQRSLTGKTRMAVFTVTARSVEHAYVSGTSQGQIEVRPLISPWFLWSVVLVLAAILGYHITRPRPVVIHEFGAEPETVMQGAPATLRWRIDNASAITITPDVGKVTESVGAIQVIPNETTEYKLTASGRGGEAVKQITVQVTPAPKPPAPEINALTADRNNVLPGEPVNLSWKIKNATRLFLSPPGEEIDPVLPSREVTPMRTTTYTLVASNAGGETVQKTVVVTVNDPNALKVIRFDAQPRTVDPGGKAVLRWAVNGAVEVLLDGTPVDAIGEREEVLTETRIYTLQVRNDRGEQLEKKLKIVVVSGAPTSTAPPVPNGN